MMTPGDKWSIVNSWHKVALKLLKLSLVVNWEVVPVGKNVTAGAVY